MNKLNLTTRLNIKVICVVCVFMIVVILHSQWVFFAERKAACSDELIAVTDFISKRIPEKTLMDVVSWQDIAGDEREKVLLINRRMQPLIDNVFVSDNSIKFGIYLRKSSRIIAIGPKPDSSLLIALNSKTIEESYRNDEPLLAEKSNSMVWHGAKIIYHTRPIKVGGEIVGHVFACGNLDKLYQDVSAKTLNMLFMASIGLIIVIVFFQDIFIRLKKDLELFALQIVKGDAKNFSSELPELTPVFQYIREQTEQMTRLDRLNIIGEMAASIGHEVRNPMTTVRGFLQYLGTKDSFAGYQTHFALMIEEMDRANAIITEFLSLAKNKNMDFQKTSLNEVIYEIEPLLSADVLRNNCQLKMDCREVPFVLLDRNSMRQLILNMIRNAIEAMPEGGVITISTQCLDGKVVLAIQDEGPGIPPDVLDKLGTPFFTTKDMGTGLGLAVCYRIVERHGAHLAIESSSGGAVFKIFFEYA